MEKKVIPTTVDDGEMGWEEPGPFNVSTKADDTATDKPSTKECVKNDSNNYISIVPSPIWEAGREQKSSIA